MTGGGGGAEADLGGVAGKHAPIEPTLPPSAIGLRPKYPSRSDGEPLTENSDLIWDVFDQEEPSD